MKDGFSMTHPGQGNPGIIEPAGPIDPQVGVLGAGARKGNSWAASSTSHAMRRPAREGSRQTMFITSKSRSEVSWVIRRWLCFFQARRET